MRGVTIIGFTKQKMEETRTTVRKRKLGSTSVVVQRKGCTIPYFEEMMAWRDDTNAISTNFHRRLEFLMHNCTRPVHTSPFGSRLPFLVPFDGITQIRANWRSRLTHTRTKGNVQEQDRE